MKRIGKTLLFKTTSRKAAMLCKGATIYSVAIPSLRLEKFMVSTSMIFSAGLGTRFKPWTDKHPKALAVVNGKVCFKRNVEYLQQYGIRNVVVNVHHFGDQIIDAVKRNHGWGSDIHYK
jgi:hypothetical protein